MPGFDRTQQSLISQVQMKQILDGYAESAERQMRDTMKLLAEQTQRNFKSPSVYFAGFSQDAVSTYNPKSQSNAANKLFLQTVAGQGAFTVFVFPIGDADVVRIVAQATGVLGSNQALLLFFALSPNDCYTQIPMERFAMTRTRSSVINGTNLITYANEEIPCAGNKFLHVFGVLPGSSAVDFMGLANAVSGGNLNFFSYNLIK